MKKAFFFVYVKKKYYLCRRFKQLLTVLSNFTSYIE